MLSSGGRKQCSWPWCHVGLQVRSATARSRDGNTWNRCSISNIWFGLWQGTQDLSDVANGGRGLLFIPVPLVRLRTRAACRGRHCSHSLANCVWHTAFCIIATVYSHMPTRSGDDCLVCQSTFGEPGKATLTNININNYELFIIKPCTLGFAFPNHAAFLASITRYFTILC